MKNTGNFLIGHITEVFLLLKKKQSLDDLIGLFIGLAVVAVAASVLVSFVLNSKKLNSFETTKPPLLQKIFQRSF